MQNHPHPPTRSRKTINVDEWAQILGIGRNHAYQLVHEGRVRSIRIGRRILIPATEIEAFIEREVEAGR